MAPNLAVFPWANIGPYTQKRRACADRSRRADFQSIVIELLVALSNWLACVEHLPDIA
jgi:hypothetical protein